MCNVIQSTMYTFMDQRNMYHLTSATCFGLLGIFWDTVQYKKKILKAIAHFD